MFRVGVGVVNLIKHNLIGIKYNVLVVILVVAISLLATTPKTGDLLSACVTDGAKNKLLMFLYEINLSHECQLFVN